MILKHMYDVHNSFLSWIWNSNEMQNFFFTSKIFKLITFANFDVCSNFFMHVFSIISIDIRQNVFFRPRCSFLFYKYLTILFRFFLLSIIFNKDTFLMFRRKNWRFCILKWKIFFFHFWKFELIISVDFLKIYKYWTIISDFSK